VYTPKRNAQHSGLQTGSATKIITIAKIAEPRPGQKTRRSSSMGSTTGGQEILKQVRVYRFNLSTPANCREIKGKQGQITAAKTNQKETNATYDQLGGELGGSKCVKGRGNQKQRRGKTGGPTFKKKASSVHLVIFEKKESQTSTKRNKQDSTQKMGERFHKRDSY